MNQSVRLWRAAARCVGLVPSRRFIVAGALVAVAGGLAGVTAAGAQVVSEIVVEQEGQPVVDALVNGLVEPRVGMPLDMRQVRETVGHLMTLSRYEDVQVFRDVTPSGIRLRISLSPAHPLDRVEFRGALGMPESDVRRAMIDRFGAVPAAGRAGDVVRGLEAFYRSRGFTAAAIEASVEESHRPDRASLVFQIRAGSRARITAVALDAVSEAERTAALADLDVRVGALYDAESLQNRLDRYEADLHARGYYEARAAHTVRFEEGGARVALIVERGPLVTLVFEGDPLPEDERDRLVPVRTEASVDEDLLEDSTRAIEEYFRARGYRDAVASYARRTDGDQLRVAFTIARGRRYVIDAVAAEGNNVVPTSEALQALGLATGAAYVQESLDAGVGALRALYRSRGFTRPDVRAEVSPGPLPAGQADRTISVALTIVEGPQTRIDAVTFAGATVFSQAALSGMVALAVGRPFTEADVESARARLDVEYRDRGFDAVVIQARVTLRDDERSADVAFTITEGAQAIVDHIIIVGARRTSPVTIERELTIRSGQPLGASALAESQQRLAALGLFRRIQLTPVAHPGDPRRDVIVQIDEAPPTTIGYGGGVEGGVRLRPTGEGGQAEERFEVAPRGFFEVGRRNLWGKNRSVNLFGRVSLRTRDVVLPDGTTPEPLAGEGGYGFHEYRLYGLFREPRVAGSSADLVLTGIINQAVRSSFNFITREARAELGRRVAAFTLAARYAFENTRLFDERIPEEEKPIVDRLFPQVRLSGLSASVIRDTRDDSLYPNRGVFSVIDGEVAARRLGSEVGYIKTFVQTAVFLPVPARRRVILALSARVGAARAFSPFVDAVVPGGQPTEQVVEDLPASKRFFAGGDTTVRGFALDRLGDEKTISPTGFPTGGNGEIIFNTELRVSMLRNRAEIVTFLDAGNVFRRASDLDLTNLRGAAGMGLRYRSPVGPIRVDLGFNLKRRELVPGELERAYVLHISLGQAF